MHILQQIKSFLKAHLAARILLGVVVAVIILCIALHPQGTKTFLLLGMDNYGSLNESARSDVTMLVHVDFSRAKISAITFARDMFIDSENNKPIKINTVLRTSRDEQALCALMEKNFGIPIDGWFRLNFTSVIELVDAIGGAEVDLTKAEVRYLADKGLNVYPENPLQEGKSRLNGAQALAYARCRKLDNDMGRGERQGKLIAAMVRQTKHLTAARIVDVFNSLKHAWHSSYSIAEQGKLLFQALWLRGAKVQNLAVPFEGEWRYGNAGSNSGVVADLEDNRRLLLEALNLPISAAEK